MRVRLPVAEWQRILCTQDHYWVSGRQGVLVQIDRQTRTPRSILSLPDVQAKQVTLLHASRNGRHLIASLSVNGVYWIRDGLAEKAALPSVRSPWACLGLNNDGDRCIVASIERDVFCLRLGHRPIPLRPMYARFNGRWYGNIFLYQSRYNELIATDGESEKVLIPSIQCALFLPRLAVLFHTTKRVTTLPLTARGWFESICWHEPRACRIMGEQLWVDRIYDVHQWGSYVVARVFGRKVCIINMATFEQVTLSGGWSPNMLDEREGLVLIGHEMDEILLFSLSQWMVVGNHRMGPGQHTLFFTLDPQHRDLVSLSREAMDLPTSPATLEVVPLDDIPRVPKHLRAKQTRTI